MWIRIALAVITLGIWFTAVYTSHHYIIDVLLGIACALLGFIIFEYLLMRIPPSPASSPATPPTYLPAANARNTL